ncbi:MAG TPA: hypothetical protein VHC43_18220 [Mycobacteriales bacterium]|nr:hypothetical protein [Mycobacteriales bacterium]
MNDLDQFLEDLAQLREDVDYLTSIVDPGPALPPSSGADASVASRADAPGPPTDSRAGIAHVWHSLTAHEADRAWSALTEWVDWLTSRFTLDDAVPMCWYRHGAMVDELDALRAAWAAAYLDPHARPVDASYWLESLDRALMRLRVWDRYGCTAGTHHEDSSTCEGRTGGERESYLRGDIDGRALPRPLYAVPPEPSVDR